MKKITLILLAIMTSSVFANDVNIKGVDLKSDKSTENRLKILVEGNLNDNPQIKINDRTLQITIPNSHVNSKIQRKFDDTTITATQSDRSTVDIKAVL
ncbi:MAG: hypothetical protein EHM20_06605, partial [Alphaproteobacteria bacterium]